MPISPLPQGSLLPILAVQLFSDGPNPYTPGPVVDLTGLNYSNFSLNIYNIDTKVDRVGQGNFIVPSATITQGLVQYAWNMADTAIPGNYQLFISAMFLGGPLIFGPIPLVITPK